MTHIVVIGAGQAGSSLVVKLRNLGFDGDITLVGAETAPPYQRPPLSKKYLLGEMDVERLFLRPEAFYADQNIILKLGHCVTAIDADAKTVTLNDESITYDHLALTTGSIPRRLPAAIGGTLKGVHVVRDLKDVDAMAPAFTKNARVLIIGGGYIGLEAAAVAATLGLNVTLVEMADRILQRVAAPETSDYFRALHIANGVDIREGVGLDHLIGDTTDSPADRPHVTGARLSDGSEINIDFAIVGVGITPATALAEMAGVTLDNGIQSNARGQTSNPAIWTAGDCASFPHKGTRIRLESVQNAIDQSENVAQNMLGADVEYLPYPWFWSDQYDVKLQIAGLNTGYNRIVTRPGDGATTSFWYYRDDTLLAVDAMNDPRAFMVAKRLLHSGKSPAPDAVANPATELKTLLK